MLTRLFGVHWHYPHYPRQGSRPASAIRDGRHKLVEHLEDGRLERFNLKSDIGEQQDLSKEKPEWASKLLTKLEEWREKVGAQMPRENPKYDPDAPLRDAYWMPNTP